MKGMVDFLYAENVLIVEDSEILHPNQEMAEPRNVKGLCMARPADAKSFKERMLASFSLVVSNSSVCASPTKGSPRIAILNRKKIESCSML
jgi:hypothetical protein